MSTQGKKTYKVYRNGVTTLTERVVNALTHFGVHNGNVLPAAVIVNQKDEAEVSEILKALNLVMPVVANGGVLTGEVWFQVTEDGGAQ